MELLFPINLTLSAICLTVDSADAGKREANARNRFTYPDRKRSTLDLINLPDVQPENFVELYEQERKLSPVTNMNDFIMSLYDHSLSWKDIEWLCTITKLPIILKGILT